METSYRLVSGMAAAVAALFAPVAPLIGCALLFIGVDFLTGVTASRAEARRQGQRWRFESAKAWRTLRKAALAVTAIAMAWLLDSYVLDNTPPQLARLFTGFTCGVELWSFLENAERISNDPLFNRLRRLVSRLFRFVGQERADSPTSNDRSR